MTAQNKLKKFLRWIGNSHSSSRLNETHPPLQRRLTADFIAPSVRKDIEAGGSIEPHSSYREAVEPSCGEDCACHCHNDNHVKSQLTLCRCAMSGYESYRKAVYGGPQHTRHHKRRSLEVRRAPAGWGSADTLGSTNSGDTIKASSGYCSNRSDDTGESSHSQATTSPTVNDSKLSISPVSPVAGISPVADGTRERWTTRDRELTLTDPDQPQADSDLITESQSVRRKQYSQCQKVGRLTTGLNTSRNAKYASK